MLYLSSHFLNRQILSLRIGRPVGRAGKLLINPNSLKIEGWFSTSTDSKDQMILPVGEIREIISKGIVVDDLDALTHPEDLIRLKKIIDIEFTLLGKAVITEGGKKIGKIQDFAIDNDTMYIKKIYASQNLIQAVSGSQLMIDRSQIVEITDKKIIVKNSTIKKSKGVNVFKSTATAT